MEDIKEYINKVQERSKGKLSPQQLKMQEEALVKVLEEGKPVHEAIGVTKDGLEKLYSQGFNLYNAAKYKEAQDLFFILNFLDNTDLRYPFAIGACYHRLKKYEDALAMYLLCSLQDTQNPTLYWHMADCYAHLGKKMNAFLCFSVCLKLASVDPSFESLKTRAERELLAIEQELEKEMATKPK